MSMSCVACCLLGCFDRASASPRQWPHDVTSTWRTRLPSAVSGSAARTSRRDSAMAARANWPETRLERMSERGGGARTGSRYRAGSRLPPLSVRGRPRRRTTPPHAADPNAAHRVELASRWRSPPPGARPRSVGIAAMCAAATPPRAAACAALDHQEAAEPNPAPCRRRAPDAPRPGRRALPQQPRPSRSAGAYRAAGRFMSRRPGRCRPGRRRSRAGDPHGVGAVLPRP